MRTPSRARRAAACAAVVALSIAAFAAGTAGPVFAAGASASAIRTSGAPDLLEPSELPQERYGTWQAGSVSPGLPEVEPFCVEGVLPAQGARHREFQSEYDASATQVVVSLRDEDGAWLIAKEAAQAVERCAERWQEQYPEGRARWLYYGELDVADGARVYGVFTTLPDSEPTISLYAVGRDRDTVTVVELGQMGEPAEAPVRAFKRTARIAVDKLLS
ncbi:hypothetical protein C3Y87_10400 [Carbonactinospora thermoautotrophica]|uniref:hypothetical protein n=1 Tax=Carbonactinospora thermoautotrophica TaxID=1469144 RepID=UPI0022719D5C|nr:hypothetical protein [Carbonactinospora thermoautotrophica]MCX9191817.1 hypothetical protein [Carbonactinospora thermoautotrophica]